MDPFLTTILSAIVVGASKGATETGEKVIADAYAALKHVIIAGYGQASALFRAVTGLEEKADSKGRKDTLTEELEASDALHNEELLEKAEALLKAARNAQVDGKSIGIHWDDVEVAELKISQIRAEPGGIGMYVTRSKLDKVEIGNIGPKDVLGN